MASNSQEYGTLGSKAGVLYGAHEERENGAQARAAAERGLKPGREPRQVATAQSEKKKRKQAGRAMGPMQVRWD